MVGSSTAVDGVDAARAAFELDAWSRPLITALKYRGQRRVARWLGREMAMLVPLAVDVVTWVPTTPERRQRRGYDHAEQLARSVAVAAGLPVQRLLGRAPGDQRQTEQSRRDRLTGPRILPVRAVGGMVLVVDDVLTTGSTARVSAAVLRRAGAERVIALTAAQTPRRRHDTHNRDGGASSSIHSWKSKSALAEPI